MKDFAIIKISGTQEVVYKNAEILVNRIKNKKEKDKIELKDVLLLNKNGKLEIGKPTVKNAVIKAEIIEHLKGPKVIKQTYKAKARQRRKVGHRQLLTKLKILSI